MGAVVGPTWTVLFLRPMPLLLIWACAVRVPSVSLSHFSAPAVRVQVMSCEPTVKVQLPTSEPSWSRRLKASEPYHSMPSPSLTVKESPALGASASHLAWRLTLSQASTATPLTGRWRASEVTLTSVTLMLSESAA